MPVVPGTFVSTHASFLYDILSEPEASQKAVTRGNPWFGMLFLRRPAVGNFVFFVVLRCARGRNLCSVSGVSGVSGSLGAWQRRCGNSEEPPGWLGGWGRAQGLVLASGEPLQPPHCRTPNGYGIAFAMVTRCTRARRIIHLGTYKGNHFTLQVCKVKWHCIVSPVQQKSVWPLCVLQTSFISVRPVVHLHNGFPNTGSVEVGPTHGIGGWVWTPPPQVLNKTSDWDTSSTTLFDHSEMNEKAQNSLLLRICANPTLI